MSVAVFGIVPGSSRGDVTRVSISGREPALRAGGDKEPVSDSFSVEEPTPRAGGNDVGSTAVSTVVCEDSKAIGWTSVEGGVLGAMAALQAATSPASEPTPRAGGNDVGSTAVSAVVGEDSKAIGWTSLEGGVLGAMAVLQAATSPASDGPGSSWGSMWPEDVGPSSFFMRAPASS
jgi:hypothetical protein